MQREALAGCTATLLRGGVPQVNDPAGRCVRQVRLASGPRSGRCRHVFSSVTAHAPDAVLRRHIDLLRTASAMCRTLPRLAA